MSSDLLLLWLEDDVLSKRRGIKIGANSRKYAYALTYLPELPYVSTIVLLVVIPTYVQPKCRQLTKTTRHCRGPKWGNVAKCQADI